MLTEQEMKILAYLRANGRHTVTQIGHKLGIPRTSVFDKIKKFRKLGLISKFTCVVNFEAIGHAIQANVFFRARGDRTALGEALAKCSHTNTVVKLGNDYDFFTTFVFPNMNELHDYLDHLKSKYEIEETKIYYVARELKREGFMSNFQIVDTRLSQPQRLPVQPPTHLDVVNVKRNKLYTEEFDNDPLIV